MRQVDRVELEDFKAVLNQEIAVYDKIERYMSHKKDVIIQGDIDSMAKMDTEIEELSSQASELEKKRLVIMAKMGHEGQTLREFIDSMETGDDTQLLTQLRERMIRSTSAIKELGQAHHDLLTQSIRLVEQSVDFIASILSPEGAGYSDRLPNGKAGSETANKTAYRIHPSTISCDA